MKILKITLKTIKTWKNNKATINNYNRIIDLDNPEADAHYILKDLININADKNLIKTFKEVYEGALKNFYRDDISILIKDGFTSGENWILTINSDVKDLSETDLEHLSNLIKEGYNFGYEPFIWSIDIEAI